MGFAGPCLFLNTQPKTDGATLSASAMKPKNAALFKNHGAVLALPQLCPRAGRSDQGPRDPDQA